MLVTGRRGSHVATQPRALSAVGEAVLADEDRARCRRHATIVALGVLAVALQELADRRSDQLNATADFVVSALQNNLDDIEREARAIAGLVAASEELTSSEFETFVDTALATPGVLGRGVVGPMQAEDGTTEWVFIRWEAAPGGPDWTGKKLPSSRTLRFEPHTVFERREVRSSGFMRLNLGTETILVIAPAKADDRLASGILIDVEALRVGSMSDALGNLARVTVHGATPTPDGDFHTTLPITIGDRIYQVQVAPVEGSAIGPVGRPWRWAGGLIALMVGIIAGVGAAVAVERKRVQAELEVVRRRDAARLEFLGSVSHELRTPITAMTGFTQLLRHQWDDLTDEDRRDMVRLADEQGTEVVGMITDLLVLTRGESGALQLSMDCVSLQGVVERATAAVPQEFQDRVDANPPDISVWADPARLAQVIRNLVVNGIKHGEGTVRVHGTVENSTVVIQVTDEGRGIPPDALATLFEPFTTASGSDRVMPSTGLGLDISRQLVELMSGSLRYSRDQGLSVFEIRLGSVPGIDRSPSGPDVSAEQPPLRPVEPSGRS